MVVVGDERHGFQDKDIGLERGACLTELQRPIVEPAGFGEFAAIGVDLAQHRQGRREGRAVGKGLICQAFGQAHVIPVEQQEQFGRGQGRDGTIAQGVEVPQHQPFDLVVDGAHRPAAEGVWSGDQGHACKEVHGPHQRQRGIVGVFGPEPGKLFTVGEPGGAWWVEQGGSLVHAQVQRLVGGSDRGVRAKRHCPPHRLDDRAS